MRTMSGKVKWAIGLLVVWMVLGFGRLVQATQSSSFLLVITMLFECMPTIAVIVLTHYDHKYAAPKNGTFTLLRVWALALIWFQPVLSLLSYIAAGAFTSFILGVWVASCLFPLIAFTLLFVDGKSGQVTTHGSKIHLTDTPKDREISKASSAGIVKTALFSQKVYFFNDDTIQELHTNSLVHGQLNAVVLGANILQYKQTISQQQNKLIKLIQQEMTLPYMNSFDILHEVSLYKMTKQPTEDELKQFIKNAIIAFYDREERPDKLVKPSLNVTAIIFYIAATAIIAIVTVTLAIVL